MTAPLATIERTIEGDEYWSVRYRGRIVMNWESFTIADAVRDGLNGRLVVGEIAEAVAAIKKDRD